MVNADLIFGGIEGGGTHSNIILIDGQGKHLATVVGPATNHWLVGIEECQNRIKKLVEEAKAKARLPPNSTLDGLGLCLSGCEQESTNRELEEGLRRRYPNLADTIFVGSDTIGSLSTACRNGGVIIISGTGSNSLLMNPDGGVYHSGGWGHMIGDEGGAYWIAARAVKLVFDEDDNLIDPPHSTALLRKLVFDHFQLTDRYDILQHCYSNFEKQRYASLTAKISKAASDGDQTCLQLMNNAGYFLGRYISALSRNMDSVMFTGPRGLEIVCSGSVFKSWSLLKSGFLEGIKPQNTKDKLIPKFTLLRLEVTSANGAVYQAARKHGYDLPRDYSENSKPIFTYDMKDAMIDMLHRKSETLSPSTDLLQSLTIALNNAHHESTNGQRSRHGSGAFANGASNGHRSRHNSASNGHRSRHNSTGAFSNGASANGLPNGASKSEDIALASCSYQRLTNGCGEPFPNGNSLSNINGIISNGHF